MAWRKNIASPVLWVVWLGTRAALYLLATVPGRIGDVGPLPAVVHMLFLATALSRWPTRCGSIRPAQPWSSGCPAACPAATWTISCSWPLGCDLAVTVMLCSSARRGGSLAGAWYWVCGVPLLGPVSRRQVRRGPGRAVGRRPVRDRPRRRPRRADRGRDGGEGYGRSRCWPGSLPASGAAVLPPPRRCCRGRRHLRQRDGELPRAPERPRRRDRIGRRDAVHDLAASRLARDGGVPVRRVAAQRGARRARAGRVPRWASSSPRRR